MAPLGTRCAGKVAIVSGGSLGIGKSSCVLLAKQGAKVAVCARNIARCQEVVDEIKAFGGEAHAWSLDTSNEQQTEQVFKEVAEKWGKIDVLVNNAGIGGVNKPPDQIELKEWEAVMSVNCSGVFLSTKHVIPYMRKAGVGSIINMSSIYGLVGAADSPPYHAAKGAVTLMTKNDALTYAKEKIRVNAVHPGFIWTPMVENFGKESPLGADGMKAYLAAKHPVGYVGEPDDIGYAVVYLASDESKFVTGSSLVVDGGYVAQ